jgi:peptidoglycan/xylan/chitin deacetylase (PgdA/CDA1 family)
MAGTSIPILTYHSISSDEGPMSIPADTFAAQMDAVADLGVDVVSLDRVVAFVQGDWRPERRTIAITFDDAFADFAAAAYPILERHKFAVTVFAPSALVGARENWPGGNTPGRPLMGWNDMRALAKAGVAFGSHARSHPDLTRLDPARLRAEVEDSRHEIEDAIGTAVLHFAPPYGRSNEAVRSVIAEHYASSAGVRFHETSPGSPRFDLPRIEMHYFRDKGHWRSFLAGQRVYFRTRQALRGVREVLASAASKGSA